MSDSEKSFSEIWSNSFELIPKNRFNFWTSKVGILLGIIPLVSGEVQNFCETLSPLVGTLLQVYAGLLGFIIAGYTLFLSSSSPEFQLAYWRFKSTNGTSLLKLHLLIYMKLFLTIFAGTLYLGLLMVLFFAWSSLSREIQFGERITIFIQGIVLALLGWSMSGAAIQMKVMIFNLYDYSLTQFAFVDNQNKTAKSEKKTDSGTNS